MRESIPYKIIGGVRFYERKEIKDSLAYLKLIINPHDDVSLRRVVNVPARGVGKGVMDGAAGDRPGRRARRCAAAPRRGLAGDHRRARSLWAKLVYAVEDGKLPNRAVSSLRVFRDLIASLAQVARQEPVSIVLGKMLDQTGYLKSLRDENSEEANERIENLMELVSAARDYETREAEASLGGFVDRLSLLSEADEESGSREARVWLMTMHAAKGLEFPVVVDCRARRGPLSALARRRGRRGNRGRAPPVLRRHDEGAVEPGAHERRPPPGIRRVPVDRAVTLPRRDSGRAGRAHRAGLEHRVSERVQPQPLRAPHEPVRAEGPRHGCAETETAYAYENEDQSAMGLRTGMRVRHPQFGVGTVMAVEEHNDDLRSPCGSRRSA